ncbi:glucosyl transferase [Escherichia coli]|uniref:glucosyl transferase n=2 Tax=Escherichia coli TaxID=562 RepID=UPI00190BB6EA|nr:glucosyl transferase [Escherichia coli]
MNNLIMKNWCKLSIFIIAFILLWLRRPDILTNAQFWAEDSVFWYKDAYENGFLSSLTTPRNGYFQTVSTFIVGLTALLNPDYAPFVSNFFGIMIRSVIIWFLFTERFNFLTLTTRIFLSIYFLCMPGLDEVHANITNAHWYLSLYVSMILIARNPSSKSWRFHDIFFILLSGLSGPFIIFILAASCFKFINNCKDHISVRSFINFYLRQPYALMIVCALIQGTSIILTFNGTRSSAPLGFSFDVISSIISSNIFLFTFVPWDIAKAGWDNLLLSYFLSVSILSCAAFVFVKGTWRMKVFATLPLLIIIFSMAKPQLTDSAPQLPTLINGQGSRYFVNIHIAIFSLLCVYLLECVRGKVATLFSKIYLTILLFVMGCLNFVITPLPNMNWREGATLINNAKTGDVISIQVLPPGLTLELRKK